jgi:hypothetical protein
MPTRQHKDFPMSDTKARVCLSGADKYKLNKWAEENVTQIMTMTVKKAAEWGKAELQLEINENNLGYALKTIGAPPRQKNSAVKTSERIDALEARVAELSETLVTLQNAADNPVNAFR